MRRKEKAKENKEEKIKEEKNEEKKNKEKRMPWREAIHLNRRAVALLARRYPQMVASCFLYQIWVALTPYVGIYLSALLVEELSGSRDPERLCDLVLMTLVSAALIALVTAFLNRWKSMHEAGWYYKLQRINAEKFLEMDYVDCEASHTEKLRSSIYQNMQGGGWGLWRTFNACQSLLSALFTVLGGVSLTVSLFTNRVSDDAGMLTGLNHPLVGLGIVALLLIVTFLSPSLYDRGSSYWAKYAGLHNMGNRLFSFFGYLGYEKKTAMDVRIYNQGQFCEKYNQDKTGTFGSAGLFAHLAIGPIGLYNAASSAMSAIFTGLAYAYVCLKSWAGAFGLGSVTQYVASITMMRSGIASFASNLVDMRSNAAFLKIVFELLDIPNRMYQGSLTVEKRQDRKYEIEFRNVSFRYPGSADYALRNVSVKFEIGSRMAVVGRNGSGKTTFVKLLCRLYDPTEGEILLNGINIRKYNYEEYMNIFSIVFQDFDLFAFKLGENVATSSEYDAARVTDCLKEAGFAERLNSLERGIDTYLYKDYDGDGVDVSGGEAQKIAIARALYKDAPFIILDEPTAALDPVAEAEIYSRFNEIVGDKTAVYISHRLSSCRFCDKILVFSDGTITQAGTHAALLQDPGGEYAKLWTAQAQYYDDTRVASL